MRLRVYSDEYKVKGGVVARLVLDLPQELIAELVRRARKSGKSIPDFSCEELELRYLHWLPRRERGDISDYPEVRRAIQLQHDMRRRLKGSGYNGWGIVSEMRDRR